MRDAQKPDDGQKIMTVRDLREMLELLAVAEEDVDDDGPPLADLKVYVRVQTADGTTVVGGLFAVDVDEGCTEVDALLLDGSTEVS